MQVPILGVCAASVGFFESAGRVGGVPWSARFSIRYGEFRRFTTETQRHGERTENALLLNAQIVHAQPL